MKNNNIAGFLVTMGKKIEPDNLQLMHTISFRINENQAPEAFSNNPQISKELNKYSNEEVKLLLTILDDAFEQDDVSEMIKKINDTQEIVAYIFKPIPANGWNITLTIRSTR